MSETASAPLPPELARRSADPLGDAVFRNTSLRVIRERNGAHIPSFYSPHENPDQIVVKQNGIPVPGVGEKKAGFTVADVAPERRWAIRPSGDLMPQHVFESHLLLARDEWFNEVEGVKPPGDLNKEVIPTVQAFVNKTPDPVNPKRLIPIGFDENAKPDPDFERKLWDSKGEESVSGRDRLQVLVDAYHSQTLRKTLKPWEVDEVEAHIKSTGASVPGGGDLSLVVQLEQLNRMLKDGDITADVHSRRVAALTGASDPTPEPEKPKRRPGYSAALCGEEVANVQKKRHQAECPKCQEMAPSE